MSLKWVKRLTLVGFLFVVLVTCAVMLLDPSIAHSINERSLNRATFFVLLRWTLYGIVIWRWESIIQYFLREKGRSISAQALARSKRLLISMLVGYELVFGLDLIHLMLAGG